MDKLTAQQLFNDWAVGRGWKTTLLDPDPSGDNPRLYFHLPDFKGFAHIDFEDSPKITLTVSSSEYCTAEYELNMADKLVFTQIERILTRVSEALEG